MLMRFSAALPAILVAVATLALTASASRAEVLPSVSNPRLIRQTVLVECNTDHPQFGSNLCVVTFDKVPNGSLLQVDKLTCFGSTSGAMFIFNTLLRLEAANVMGLVLPPFSNAGAGQSNGPYYFKAGERPRLAGTASSPTTQAFCNMSGTLWDAQS